jgi:hypothetical protein
LKTISARKLGKYHPTLEWLSEQQPTKIYGVLANEDAWKNMFQRKGGHYNFMKCLHCDASRFSNYQTRHRCEMSVTQQILPSGLTDFTRHRIRYPHDIMERIIGDNTIITTTGDTITIPIVRRNVQDIIAASDGYKYLLQEKYGDSIKKGVLGKVYGTLETSEYHWLYVAIDKYLVQFSDSKSRFNPPRSVFKKDGQLLESDYNDNWALDHSSKIKSIK